MTDLAMLDATAQAELVRSGTATAGELVDGAIQRIEKLNGELNAVIHALFERAHVRAVNGIVPGGPFSGVPIVVKDLDGTVADAPYHAGNKLLKDQQYIAQRSSHFFQKLENAGFVIVGKSNTPEFGLMTTTESRAYGPARNPWNTEYSPGGSSGGSAAAVASGMVPVAHAGDGGGSIRIPASHCALFGLKPSRGRVSFGPDEGEAWAGLVTRHVLTHSVRDSAAVLDIVHGYETGDWYTAPPPARPYAQEVGANPGSLRVGIRTTAPLGLAEVDPECILAVERAGHLLEQLGHAIDDSAPAALDDPRMLGSFSTVMQASVAAEFIRIEADLGRPMTADDVEPSTWALAEAGRAVNAGQYIDALAQAHRWNRDVTAWWTEEGHDILMTPTCALPPPKIGELTDPEKGTERQLPYAIFTAPFNVSGQPAMSVPFLVTKRGLPVGVQFVAAPHREDLLIRLAAQLEQAAPWIDRRPPLHA
jgi:amidase